MSALHRGSESAAHRELKQCSVALLRRSPYRYEAHLFEARCCDAVLMRRGEGTILLLGMEVQLSRRHILVNCRRDLKFCHRVLVVTPDERLAAAVVRQVGRLSPEDRERISVAFLQHNQFHMKKGMIP